jgi:dTDP-glucose 4,6-dehydratase
MSKNKVKVIYVTGCLGFIGYHVTVACLNRGWYVRGIDKCTYASNINLLSELNKYNNFVFDQIDINDIERFYECDYIINTAAETHVDNSIVSSDAFLRSNINGVHHILNLVKKSHKITPTLIHFSTDEVYGDIVDGSHSETDLLKPSNPYSATKAAADMLILAWARTYQIPFVIVRPTNNYGTGQYVEKLIPRSIKFLNLGKKIQLHENGKPKRTWLHASDTAAAIIKIIESGVQNEIYNISGNYEDKNIVVVEKLMRLMGIENFESHLDLTIKRPGQDVRYSVNDDKLKKLGWFPKANFDNELEKIVEYYKNNFIW